MTENNDILLKDDIKKLIEEIKILKNQNINTLKLFEQACQNLNFQIEKYFREDISVFYLYSCQIKLNKRYFSIGTGKTMEDAYINALYINLDAPRNDEKLFTDEIQENIININICNSFVSFSKKYFFKNEKTISKYHRINYNHIKMELIEKSELKLVLSENYRCIDNKRICSIFLNVDLLLQQGSGTDDIEALENTAKELFASYSIYSPDYIISTKTKLNKEELLSKLRNHLENKTGNYYEIIKSYVETLNYKMNIKFKNSVSTIEIDGIIFAEGNHEDEYCSYIIAARKFVKLIRNSKTYVPPAIEKKQLNSVSPNKTSVAPNDLSPEEFQTVLQKIALNSQKEHKSDGKREYWSILNCQFKNEGLKIEPSYIPNQGQTTCILKHRYAEIVRADGSSKEKSREEVAKEYIKKYSTINV